MNWTDGVQGKAESQHHVMKRTRVKFYQAWHQMAVLPWGHQSASLFVTRTRRVRTTVRWLSLTGTTIQQLVWQPVEHREPVMAGKMWICSTGQFMSRSCCRPSHADATYDFKYGIRAIAGGGRSSARETIGRVAAGAIAKKLLKEVAGTEVGSAS